MQKIFCAFGPSKDNMSDNPFLTLPITEAVKKGIKVPLIIGYNDREGIILLQGL